MSWVKDPRRKKAMYYRLRKRDGSACAICRQPLNFRLLHTGTAWSPTIDHFVPVSAGGTNVMVNLRLAHRRCNTDRQAGDWLPLTAQPGSPEPAGPVTPDAT